MAAIASQTDGNESAADTPAKQGGPKRPTLLRQLTDPSAELVDAGTNEDMRTKSSACGNVHAASKSDESLESAAKMARVSKRRLQFKFGGIKDEGVQGKENQDDFFVWQKGDNLTYVFAVLDGHGRELGKLASKAAKDSLFKNLTSDEGLASVRKDAKGAMARIFAAANDAVRNVRFPFTYIHLMPICLTFPSSDIKIA